MIGRQKSVIKNDLREYLYETKRKPMILLIIMEI